MTTIDLVTFVSSLVLIAVILIREWRRGRPPASAKLPLRMYAIRMSLGVVFLFLGVVGSLLPILQGWIFFLIAALLFFPNSRFASRALEKAEPKLPRVVAFLRRLGIGEAQPRPHPEQQDK